MVVIRTAILTQLLCFVHLTNLIENDDHCITARQIDQSTDRFYSFAGGFLLLPRSILFSSGLGSLTSFINGNCSLR